MSNQEIKKAGLKVTTPRLRILELLERNPQRHLSAEDVYRALLETGEDIGIATVYRVLAQFEAAGLAKRHHFDSATSVFELAQGEHHDHIRCTECGKIMEFMDEIIEQRQRAIAEQMAFSITGHYLYLYGVCSDCQKK